MKKRSRLIILSKFQRWFLFTFVGYTAAFLIVFGVGLFMWFQIIVSRLLDLAGLLSPTFVQQIEKHTWVALTVSLVLIFALLAVACLQAILFSRKIAGPIYGMARHLDECEAQKKLMPMKLRDGDLFADIAERFNRVIEIDQSRGGS